MTVKVISVSSTTCPHGSGACLSSEDLDFWFEAFFEEDTEDVERHLAALGPQRTAELFNGHLCRNIGDLMVDLKGLNMADRKSVMYRVPYMMVIGWGSDKLIELCLRHGVNTLVTDRGGDNAMHALARASSLALKWENRYSHILEMLRDRLSPYEVRQLLLQENDAGFRPLELAAHFGSFGIFQEILRTEGVYLNRVVKAGGFQIEYFDITEYESYRRDDDRRMKSPLWHLAYLEESRLEDPKTKDAFTTPPIRVWCSRKIQAAMPLIVLWCLMRFVTFSVIMFWVFSGGMLEATEKINIERLLLGNLSLNESNCVESMYAHHPYLWGSGTFDIIIRCTMMLMAAQILIFDLVESCVWVVNGWRTRFLRTLAGKRKKLVSMEFEFRVMQFGVSLNIVLMLLFHYLGQEALTHVAYVCLMTCMTGTMCSFAQLLPVIGPVIISINRLFFEMLAFMAIFFLFLFPMSVFFNILMLQTSVGACPDDLYMFDVLSLMYRSFKVMLNMVNFQSFQLSEYVSIYLTHFIFIFLISILLLNFLIASFSNTINRLMENQETVVMVQRLNVALRCEYRVGLVLPWLVHWLHKKSFQYCDDTNTFWVNSIRPRNIASMIKLMQRK